MEIEQLAERMIALAGDQKRFLIAICGAPGAGKSTMAAQLALALNRRGDGYGVVVPMDGFHLDDGILEKCGLRARKGAPQTFDGDGFVHAIGRIREQRQDVYVPLFDRSLELSRSAAGIVQTTDRFVIVEGNYLLLAKAPWDRLSGLFDFSLFLDVGLEELERRSIARWLGYDYTLEQAREKCHSNDLVNARIVIENSIPADLVINN